MQTPIACLLIICVPASCPHALRPARKSDKHVASRNLPPMKELHLHKHTLLALQQAFPRLRINRITHCVSFQAEKFSGDDVARPIGPGLAQD